MTTLREAATQALEALAIGQDAAHEVAQTYHEAMAGYRPARHIAVDDDVRKIEDAITALKAALAEPQSTHSTECYQWHHKCAVAEVQRLRAENAAPPQRNPLTEWQINDLMANIDPEDVDSWSFRQGVYATEKHHGVRP